MIFDSIAKKDSVDHMCERYHPSLNFTVNLVN